MDTAPTAEWVRRIVMDAMGERAMEVRRFPTGMAHYVFDVRCETGKSLVVRMALAGRRASLSGAVRLTEILRPRGVPLPRVLAKDLDGAFPYLILERLPGTDLEALIKDLSAEKRSRVMRAVFEAQRVTSDLPAPAAHYGYAVAAEEAPHPTWSTVVEANLQRSRKRMSEAGFSEGSLADEFAEKLELHGAKLDQIAPVPFLHDTTLKNVIVTPDGEFSGIVDVDDLCFGDPRYVIALTHASLFFSGGPVAYAEEWMHLGGFAIDRIYWLYVALFLLDFLSESGQVFNGNERPMDEADVLFLTRLFREVLVQA
jgi:aminoglycoside phosphotransferase